MKGFSIEDGMGEGRHINIGESVEHEKKPIEGGLNPAFVRSSIYHQSALVESDDATGGTMVTEIRSIHPNGVFPLAAIKKLQEKGPKEVNFTVWSNTINKHAKGEPLW